MLFTPVFHGMGKPLPQIILHMLSPLLFQQRIVHEQQERVGRGTPSGKSSLSPTTEKRLSNTVR